MEESTTATPVATSSPSVSVIGQVIHTMLIKCLADLWPIYGEEVEFPLAIDQRDRLMESLNVNELSKLDGYLAAIADLLEDEMHGMDIEDELGSLWIEAVKLQSIASWTFVRKSAVQVQEDMQNLRGRLGLAA